MLTIDEIIDKSRNIFLAYPVKKVSLFGSYAKGTPTDNSDLDLIIHNSDISILEQSNLKQQLSEIFGLNIDLLDESSLSDVFRFLIKDEEIVIYEEQR